MNPPNRTVPEYANTTATGETATDYAYIQLNPSGLDKDLAMYRVYFRNYTSGSASAGADYDMGRNVLYRFTVSILDHELNVHVNKWENVFDNDFTFTGTGDDD